MVSAVVVVLISAVICTVRRIPDVCELCHVGGLFSVQLFDELGINRSAISIHSALVDFQGICNQPFVARHKVGEVSQGLRCVSVCSNVNVYSGSDACMADCSGFAKLSDQFLQGFNALVFQNRRDQFTLFGIASCNADVFLEFPFSALCIPSRPSAVAVSAGGVFVSACAEMVGGKSGSPFSGDVVHLNLHADGLLFQVFNLSFCFSVHNVFLRSFGLFPFCCNHINSKRRR